MARSTNEDRARRLAQKIADQVKRGADRGLAAAGRFMVSRVKETLSTRAPRKSVMARKSGIIYYRALTPAQKGAPPRTLSGALKASITSERVDVNTVVVGTNARSLPSVRYPSGFNYPAYHEMVNPLYRMSGKHRFIEPTAQRYMRDLGTIIGRDILAFLAAGG